MDQNKDTGSFIKRKGRLILGLLAIVSYIGFIISTFAENSFFIELFSPVTTILCVILIITCIKDLGKFKLPAILLACGIGMWVTADIILFVK